jgi:hypothetical protein
MMQARNNETGEIYDIDEEYILDVSDYYDEMEEQDRYFLDMLSDTVLSNYKKDYLYVKTLNKLFYIDHISYRTGEVFLIELEII